jgi:hypothetical protein
LTLDVEAKVLGPTRQDEINDACLLALSRAMFDRMPGAGDRRRCVRIDLNDYAVSFLVAPNSQSKHKVASLEEHAIGLAGLLADAVAHHDPNGYGVDEILGQTVESWPREHDGTQVGIYGALVESRTIAERIYCNALADAVEKFEENANGVIFVDVRTGSADLGYFAGMWELATATPVFRNVANVVITWRAEGAARRCGHFAATIFSNRNHPRAPATAELLRRSLTVRDDAPPSTTVRDPPPSGPSTWGRKALFGFAVTIPPLATKNVVVVPNAEPPPHLVQEFQERRAKAFG